jgi:hypothetical protein
MSANKQIFVRAVSRSGGTLVVTLLDAHPDIAMSYELYETLLDPTEGQRLQPKALLAWLSLFGRLPRRLALSLAPNQGLKIFLSRLNRGGLTLLDFRGLLHDHVAGGMGLGTVQERLRLIGACGETKMRREGKPHWGLKCTNRFADYQAVFPNAYFINVIRDGRDVLASQLNTGDFGATPEDLGRRWARNHLRFRRWKHEPGVRAYELFYERLARDPEHEIRRLCSFLDISFDPAMLGFHKRDLTIYKAGHLSLERISSSIDTRMIGRWRTDLSKDQADAFCRACGDAMREFGYLEEYGA